MGKERKRGRKYEEEREALQGEKVVKNPKERKKEVMKRRDGEQIIKKAKNKMHEPE